METPPRTEWQAKWEAFYVKAITDDIDQHADKGGFCWESLCVGWCMAHGFDADAAVAFYRLQDKCF